MTTYIGMDAHSKTCVFVAVNSKGRELAAVRVNTSESEILKFIRQLPGKKSLAVEECHITQWVYRLLNSEVDRFTAFNAARISRKKGPQDDFIDARNIAHQLRGNFLESVFHEDTDLSELRTVLSAYRDVVRDGTRLKNRYKAIFRSNAIETSGKTPYTDETLVDRLSRTCDKFVAKTMFDQLATYKKVKALYDAELAKSASKLPVINLLSTVPGISTVRASTIASVVCSPERFENKNKFWSYAMLVRHNQVSDGVVYCRANVTARADLKEVFMGAAQTVIQGESELRSFYDEQRKAGKDHKAAKKNLARKIAAICLSVMRNNISFNNNYDGRDLKSQHRIN